MKPHISIIMPVYNRERHLPAAVESLRAQTLSNWELVVIDDGSTDGTPDLLHEYAKKDSRIRPFHHPAATIAENRNYALNRTGGEFIGILDSDDIALPNRFAHQIAFLNGSPKLDGVGSGLEFIDANGVPAPVEKYKQRLTQPDELRRRQREGWSCFVHSSMLFRRKVMDAVGGYRPIFKLAEDDDLFLRLLDRFNLANLPETLIQYRWHSGNTTGSLDSLVHRAVALASAHLRMAGRSDMVDGRITPIDYPFLLELLEQLDEKAMPVWLMWIGLLQYYRIGKPGMLEEAWARVAALPCDEEWSAELSRHQKNRRE